MHYLKIIVILHSAHVGSKTKRNLNALKTMDILYYVYWKG